MAMDKSLHLHLLSQYKIRANSSEAQLSSASCSDSARGAFFLIKAALAIARQLLQNTYHMGAQICRIKCHPGNVQSRPPLPNPALGAYSYSELRAVHAHAAPQNTYCIGTTAATED